MKIVTFDNQNLYDIEQLLLMNSSLIETALENSHKNYETAGVNLYFELLERLKYRPKNWEHLRAYCIMTCFSESVGVVLNNAALS
jgi:hypothetical protein